MSAPRACWLALAALLGACASPPPPDAIRIGLPVAPVTLDPRYATDAASARLVRLLHRALVDFDEARRPVPDLARFARLSPVSYRFVIRRGARFSDGMPVTAADVVATYESVLDPAAASPHRAALANIAAVSARDARTVDFLLEHPDPLFAGKLVIGILSADDAAHATRRQAAFRRSSGAFALQERRRDGTVVLRRRADGLRFEFHPVRDATVRALKLVKGELDIIQGDIPPEQFEWLARQPGLTALSHPGSTFTYLGFNLATGPTAREEVRRAVAYAIDRDAIIGALFAGHARPADTLLPPDHWAAARPLRGYRHDPARARALLAQAPHAHGTLRLDLKTSSDHFRLRIATVLRAQLAEAGIDLRIRSLDWGTFYGDVKRGRFEAYTLSWVGLKLPDVYRQVFHSSAVPPRGANRGRYRSAEADRLIEAAERAPERSRQAALYHALQQHLLYDLPYVPLWFEDQLAVLRDEIEGYALDTDGSFDALARVRRAAR